MRRNLRGLRAYRSHGAVFMIALTLRLLMIFRSSGWHGSFGYDAAVYFGGSDALTYGRLPYRDFVMLHPPAITLALTPFAWLTRIVSDGTAFLVANIAFAVLGAINAALVVTLARRLGLAGTSAAAAGMFYAIWYGAVGAEYLTKLEPLGNFFLLLALVLLSRSGTVRSQLVGGLALGVLVSVKIWWAVPALAIVLWFALRESRVPTLRVCAGAVVAALAINLPFFLVAPGEMWRSVITDQLGRSTRDLPFTARVADLTSVSTLRHDVSPVALTVLVILLSAAILLTAFGAWQRRATRPIVVVLAVQLAVLTLSPSWFAYYSDYVAVALAVTIGAAVQARVPAHQLRLAPARAGLAVIVTCAALTVASIAGGHGVVRPYRGAEPLARDAARFHCVMSNAPMIQISLNVLSRGLAHGCPNWIDVTGPTYGRYRPSVPGTARRDNRAWQAALTRYLRSGDAVILGRDVGSELSLPTLQAIRDDGVAGRAHRHVLYRVNRAH